MSGVLSWGMEALAASPALPPAASADATSPAGTPAASRQTRFVNAAPGSLNLLPYRQRNARAARGRRLREWAAAALVGCVALLPVIGWQAVERVRLDAQRASIDQSLWRLREPLAEHAALLRTRNEQRKNDARARRASDPLTYLRDLIDALSYEPGDGVVLRQLRQREQETQLLATSRDHAASAAWLKRLSAIRGVRAAEMSELHSAAARRGGNAAPAVDGGVEFGAHLQWGDAAAKKGGKVAVSSSRGVTSEASGGRK
ncbi:fimbrial assembly protein [Paraburkholderia sp. D15]|uniref:fimbrial assembly protein n=1 Tax=Paraburkholderia sp. D15 TaxID=2880218 RepID=UPI0024794238|nr:fimbrial assembly protein [Paraburkholderia sp. D15]WGS49602.1 fimbrial assembly protein [Paraburkholderia sp. D15]